MFFLLFFLSILIIQLGYNWLFLILILFRNNFCAEFLKSISLFHKIKTKLSRGNTTLKYLFYYKFFINRLYFFLFKNIKFNWYPIFQKNSYYHYFIINREFWLNYKKKN